MEQSNEVLKHYEHYNDQLLTEQAIQLNWIIINVDSRSNLAKFKNPTLTFPQ